MGEFDLDPKVEGVAGAGWDAHFSGAGVVLGESPEHDSAAFNTCTSPCTSVGCTASPLCD